MRLGLPMFLPPAISINDYPGFAHVLNHQLRYLNQQDILLAPFQSIQQQGMSNSGASLDGHC